MSDLPVSISASMAAVAFDTLRLPQRVPTTAAAKEARRLAQRQQTDHQGENDEEPVSIIHSAEVALNLMDLAHRQPEQNLKHAQDAYDES